MRLNLTSPSLLTAPRPGFPQRVLPTSNVATSKIDRLSSPTTYYANSTLIPNEPPKDDPILPDVQIDEMSKSENILTTSAFPTASSTFDYLYEFSETRKVLEEFFKCPSNDDKTFEKFSDFNESEDDIESLDIIDEGLNTVGVVTADMTTVDINEKEENDNDNDSDINNVVTREKSKSPINTDADDEDVCEDEEDDDDDDEDHLEYLANVKSKQKRLNGLVSLRKRKDKMKTNNQMVKGIAAKGNNNDENDGEDEEEIDVYGKERHNLNHNHHYSPASSCDNILNDTKYDSKPNNGNVNNNNNTVNSTSKANNGKKAKSNKKASSKVQSKNFNYSPETTDYDSNCGDYDSEISFKYGSDFGLMTNSIESYMASKTSDNNHNNGLSNSVKQNEQSNITVTPSGNNYARYCTSMPVLEDGLSSGHVSDAENNNNQLFNAPPDLINTANISNISFIGTSTPLGPPTVQPLIGAKPSVTTSPSLTNIVQTNNNINNNNAEMVLNNNNNSFSNKSACECSFSKSKSACECSAVSANGVIETGLYGIPIKSTLNSATLQNNKIFKNRDPDLESLYTISMI